MTVLKWIGMATATAVLLAAGVAHAQDNPSPAASTDNPVKPKKVKPKVAKPAKPADDQAAAKPKAAKADKAKVKKLPFATVTVTNGRSVELVELTVTPSAGNGDSVSVAKKLPGGKKVVAKIAHDKDCLFDIKGVFDDGQTTEAQGVNVCKDKAINLTE